MEEVINKKQNIELKGLNRHAPEIDWIIGKPPHWTIRWGLTVMTILLISAIAMAWSYTYTDKYNTDVYIVSTDSTVYINSPFNGIIKKVLIANNKKVLKGDTLLNISTLRKDSSFVAISCPCSGTISFISPIYKGRKIELNECLLAVKPIVNKSNRIKLCYGYTDEFHKNFLFQSDKIEINIKENQAITGKISSISLIPDKNGLYYFDITFNNVHKVLPSGKYHAIIESRPKSILERININIKKFMR